MDKFIFLLTNESRKNLGVNIESEGFCLSSREIGGVWKLLDYNIFL